MIRHVFYINLTKRVDRKEHFLSEYAKSGLSPDILTRIEGHDLPNGHLGCSLSHIDALTMALEKGPGWFCIFEDDFVFRRPEMFLTDVDFALASIPNLDVLMLSQGCSQYSTFAACTDPRYKRILSTYSSSGYVVNSAYLPVLLANFREGAALQKKDPKTKHHLDMYVKPLQSRDSWYGFQRGLGHQIVGYSDTLHKMINPLLD